MRVSAVILAAGASSRMIVSGSVRPKALLPIDGTPAVDRIATALRAGGCDDVILVVGRHALEIRDGAALRGVRVTEHEGWAAGRTSSLQSGLREVPEDSDAALIALVDMPFVASATIAALVEAHRAAAADVEVCLPVQDGRRGHPILVRRALFGALFALGPDEPPRALIRRSRVAQVPVTDPGIHVDLDSPEDLRTIGG